MKLTDKDYEKIVKALLKAGYTVDTVFEALKGSGFKVKVKKKTYTGIYAARVLAKMHEQNEGGDALEL